VDLPGQLDLLVKPDSKVWPVARDPRENLVDQGSPDLQVPLETGDLPEISRK